MICEICGKTVEDDAHFCPNCGASLRRGDRFDEAYGKTPMQETAAPAAPTASSANGETISFGNWFATLILPFIPVFGMIAFLVMTVIWSFSGRVSQTKKNWARAQLLVSVIVFVMLVSMLSSMMKDPAFQSMMQEYMQMMQ